MHTYSLHAVVLGRDLASNVGRALRHAGIDPRRINLRPRSADEATSRHDAALGRIGATALFALALTALFALVLRHDARAYGLDVLAVFTVLAVIVVELSIAVLSWHHLATESAAASEDEVVIQVDVEHEEEARSAGEILRLVAIADELELRRPLRSRTSA